MSQRFVAPDRTMFASHYAERFPLYERLISEVTFILENSIKENKIEVHGIQKRIKSYDSFYGKIVRHKISGDPFSQIEDIAGIRIVCLYRTDLERIQKLITQEFSVVKADIETKDLKETEFGYMSDHYIIKLSDNCKGRRYDEIKSLVAEIQVRTILMDAWDSISHHLDYKQDIDIPSQLRRDFYALSGLFYVADTHFEMFRESTKEIETRLGKSIGKDGFDLSQEMNLDTLRAYLKWKLPRRERYEDAAYSELLYDLRQTGYIQFKKLDDALNTSADVSELSEKQDPPMRRHKDKTIPTKYSDVGFVRNCLEIHDPVFQKYWQTKFGPWAVREKQIMKLRATLKKTRC